MSRDELIFVEEIKEKIDLESVREKSTSRSLLDEFNIHKYDYLRCIVEVTSDYFTPTFSLPVANLERKPFYEDRNFCFRQLCEDGILVEIRELKVIKIVYLSDLQIIQKIKRFRFGGNILLLENQLLVNQDTTEMHVYDVKKHSEFLIKSSEEVSYRKDLDIIYTMPFNFLHNNDPFVLVEDIIYDNLLIMNFEETADEIFRQECNLTTNILTIRQ